MSFGRCVGMMLLVFAAAIPGVNGQTYPTKPVRLILPFPPGGPSDILGRALSQKLSEQLGQQVIADNRRVRAEISGSSSLRKRRRTDIRWY